MWSNRLGLTGGVRVDRYNAMEETVVKPLKVTFTAEFLKLFGCRNLRQARNELEPVLPFVPSGGLKIEW